VHLSSKFIGHNPPPNFVWAGFPGFQRCFLGPVKEYASQLGYVGKIFTRLPPPTVPHATDGQALSQA
jgi:hypothetical protein